MRGGLALTMSTLVTGGSGFVGLNVVEALLAKAETVISCDVQPLRAEAVSQLGRLPGTLHQARLDVRDCTALADLLAKYGPARIVHAAALSPSASDELALASSCMAVNAVGTAHVMDASLAANVARVVMLSSAAVYGEAGFRHPELEEATPAQPTSIYGASKFAAERIALQYRRAGLEVVVMRLGSVFGPWEHGTSARGTLSPMLQVLRFALAGEAVRLPRVGRRDWIYAPDAAAAILSALHHRGPLPEVVNVGAGRESTVAEFCALLEEGGVALSWTVDPEQPNVDLYSSADRAPLAVGVLRNLLDFVPRHDLRSATADYLAWAKSRETLLSVRS